MPPRPQLTQAKIFILISYLVRRPARADHRLPLIWLNGREEGTRVLDALIARLRTPRQYLVPHARVQAIPEELPCDIRQLLHVLCVKLAAPRFGGERLWFRHYELAEWLMGLNLSQLGTEDRAREIVTLLRGRHRPRSQDNDRGVNEIDFGPKYRLPIWLIRRIVPEALFRAAISGKVPGFGRRYRWFMRQQYLAPLQSVNFLGFAERLTEGVRELEDGDQIDKLLVHAFLQDLRRAYRRRPWRIEGWRRTAYPVVLIDNATEGSAGQRLLQLVNEVRNETGQSDPLLVVCSSDEAPQAPAQATGRNVVESDFGGIRRHSDPVYRDAVYREWVEALPGSRRARVETAWDLPISVIGSDGVDPPLEGIGPRRPPWFARRSVVAAVVVALVLSGVGWVSWQYGGGRGCPHIPFRGQINVRSINGECIGYSDSSNFRFSAVPGQEGGPGQEALIRIQDTIFAQNRMARDFWEQGNRMRPLVTLIYLGIFSGRSVTSTEEAYSGEREELEGLAVAQNDSIDQPATTKVPLLNIVIANAGQQMQYASEAVDMIGSLAAGDPTVVGVIGMDESRDTTAEALKKLNIIGLPVIATTLSADHMDRNSRLYLQVGASNRDLARMIGEYSKRVLRISEAQLYWSVGVGSSFEKDLYVQTLVNDMKEQLPNFGIVVDDKGEFDGLPEGVCGYRGAVIFAGRWNDFPNFLEAFKQKCPDGRFLNVIADDSISRYMENLTLRRSAPATLPVTYVSKTGLITCNYLRNTSDNSVARFLQLIQKPGLLYPQRCVKGNGVIGERVPVAYDAAMLVLQAIEGLDNDLRRGSSQEWDPRSIVPVSMYLKILQQIHKNPFDGVTGTIAFTDAGVDPGEPIDRRISLLKVDSITDVNAKPKEIFHCGQTRANEARLSEPGTMGPDPCGG
jgi:hypothetical protein